jgi:hypothetical protein
MSFRHDIKIKFKEFNLYNLEYLIKVLENYTISNIECDLWDGVLSFGFHEHDDECSLLYRLMGEIKGLGLEIVYSDLDGIEHYCDEIDMKYEDLVSFFKLEEKMREKKHD